jgi:hypothetical protein
VKIVAIWSMSSVGITKLKFRYINIVGEWVTDKKFLSWPILLEHNPNPDHLFSLLISQNLIVIPLIKSVGGPHPIVM